MSNILIFRSSALGDFILATPALAEVRRQFPGRRLILLTTISADETQRDKVAAYAGGALTHQSYLPWTGMATPHLIDETLVISNLASFGGIRLAKQKLQRYKFECALMLLDPCSPWPGRIKKWMMLKLVTRGAPIFGWRSRGSFNGNRERLRAAGLLGHHVHGPMQFLREMRPSRVKADAEIRFDLRPDVPALEWANAWVEQHSRARRLVAVAPGSIQPHKRWPIDRFEMLCLSILVQYLDVVIVVIGTPGDTELGEHLRALNPERVHNLAGKTSITQSAALLACTSLLVGNDGGAIHLGDAMGARVVSIVPGLEYPNSIEPWNNRNRAVRHTVSCAPCYSFAYCPEGHNNCMRELPVEQVLHQCNLALN